MNEEIKANGTMVLAFILPVREMVRDFGRLPQILTLDLEHILLKGLHTKEIMVKYNLANITADAKARIFFVKRDD